MAADNACPVLDHLAWRLKNLAENGEPRLDNWLVGLRRLAPRIQESRGSAALAERRGYIVADWTIRTAIPAVLDRVTTSLIARPVASTHAAALRALAPIVDVNTARAARAYALEHWDACTVNITDDDTVPTALMNAWQATAVSGANGGVAAYAAKDARLDPIPLLEQLLDLTD